MATKRKISDYVPNTIILAIKEHINVNTTSEIEKEIWKSANSNEDSLIGDYFGRLRCRDRSCDEWTWGINYKKFGSGGINSDEKLSGADGIITINIKKRNGECISKSLLFQAKKENNRQQLDEQKEKILSITSTGGLIIYLTENGFWGQSILESSTHLHLCKSRKYPFGDYLNNIFLTCKQGEWDLERKLINPNSGRLKDELKHQLIIDIKSRLENVRPD